MNEGKGDSPHLCEAPSGPFRQMGTVPFLSSEIGRRLELALSAAREAGRITLEYFRRDDLQSGAQRRRLAGHAWPTAGPKSIFAAASPRRFPRTRILGEELAERPGTSGFRWILDPIDGTKSFIHGVPLYSTLIGVEHEGQSVVGVILIPALDECVYAAAGSGSLVLRRRPAAAARPRVVAVRRSAEGLFLTSEVGNFDADGPPRRLRPAPGRRPAEPHLGRRLRLPDGGHGPGGVDGRSDHGRLGRAPRCSPMLEEAGGTFTDWQGRPTIHSGQGIAANPSILEEALGITRGS